MSQAYYIVLDAADPGFDPFVNGKALAKESKKLAAISKKLGLPTLDDFLSITNEDLENLLGEDLDLPEQEEKWFTADEGLTWVISLTQHIKAHPQDVKNATAVLRDLAEYAEVFRKSQEIGSLWHLTMDL